MHGVEGSETEDTSLLRDAGKPGTLRNGTEWNRKKLLYNTDMDPGHLPEICVNN